MPQPKISRAQIDDIMFQALLSLPANFYWINRKGILLGCNDKTLQKLNLSSPDNFIGKHSLNLVTQKAWENSKLVMDKKQAMQFEETQINPDGSKIIYLSIKLPIIAKNRTKEVLGLVGISIDITDRKKYEFQLKTKHEESIQKNKALANFITQLKHNVTGQKSKTANVEQNAVELVNYLENIIASMPGNVFWKDRNGMFLGCNEHVAKILKLKSRKDIIGKTNYDLFKEPTISETTKIDETVMNSGKELVIDEIGLDINGKPANYITKKKPLFDKNNHVIGLLGIAFDITKHKQTEEKIIRQLEKEKTIIETKRQTIADLAASIAHEIGNLLGGIMVNMQLLDSDLRPKINESIEKHAGKYQRTLDLLDDLKKGMENAKFMFESIKFNIRSGEISKTQFELANIADDIAIVLKNCFPNEEIIANIKWNKKENFEYVGIPAYTRNILINILKNALYFIKEQRKGTITLTLKKGKKINQLIIEDTSKGISQDLLPHIFSRFSTVRKGGMGMGLVFCKKVMHEYGGDITCESELNKYARFILTFPAIIV